MLRALRCLAVVLIQIWATSAALSDTGAAIDLQPGADPAQTAARGQQGRYCTVQIALIFSPELR